MCIEINKVSQYHPSFHLPSPIRFQSDSIKIRSFHKFELSNGPFYPSFIVFYMEDHHFITTFSQVFYFFSMVSSWLHHFPIVACPGIHLGRRGVRQVQQPAQQPQQRQGAGAFGQRAQVPEEGNHQAWGVWLEHWGNHSWKIRRLWPGILRIHF